MGSLIERFVKLKTQVGGNREKSGFEWTFGATAEELGRVTPPNRHIVRILSQIDFAIKLSAAGGMPYDDIISGALEKLEADMSENGVLTRGACDIAEQLLLPLSKSAKEYEVIFAAHAHIDMNWMWGWQETVAITISTFRTILDMMREYPDFTYSQSQASVYEIVEKYAPEMMDEIKARIAEGRWEVTATAWVETDKNMPDTESLIRHIKYTRDYLEKTWDVPRESLELDFSPDTFGHSRFVPEIDTFGGVKYYYHCRGLQDEVTLYRYKCPSGAELLMYKEPYWYNSGVTPDCGTGIFGLSERCAGLKTGLVVYGVGDHGGGPSRRDIERVIEMRDWPVFPTMKFGTIREYFKKAETVREKLPLIEHELNAIFAGCYTTQSRIKRANRKTEQALLEAEKLSALECAVTGANFPQERIEKAWRNVLFTHFHDILTGSCVQESREHAMGLFADALAHAQSIEALSAKRISEITDTSAFLGDPDIAFTQSEGAGVGFGLDNHSGVPNPERGAGKTRVYTVFNMSAKRKDGLCEITVWDYPGDISRLQAVDAAGKEHRMALIDAQAQRYWDHRYVRALVEVSVPAFGYTTLALREKTVESYPTYYLSAERTETPKGNIVLENGNVRAEFCGRSGRMISLKCAGSELLSAPAGLCVADTERTSSDAWKIGRYLGVNPVKHATKITPFERGRLRQGLEIEYTLLNSTAKAVYSLDAGASVVRCELTVDWHEAANKADTAPVLIYDMPLSSKPGSVLMDVPGGAIARDARAMDLPALSYACAPSGEVSPVIITDSKYGYRLDRGELISTLINTAGGPDPYPERGIHAIKLWIGACEPSPAALRGLSDSLVREMFAVPCAAHKGVLKREGSLMGFSAKSSVLSSVGMDGGVLVLRAFEVCGTDDDIVFTAPCEVETAALTDLEGKRAGGVRVNGMNVEFSLGAYCMAQLKLTLKR